MEKRRGREQKGQLSQTTQGVRSVFRRRHQGAGEMDMQRYEKGAQPPKSVRGKLWAMIDSGSEPTIANCEQAVPDHKVVPSAGSKKGLKYMAASGDKVPNLGECHVVHRDPKQGDFKFCFQHAPVHLPIISVKVLVRVGCKVGCGRAGGWIKYPDGRKLNFTKRYGSFFILLERLPPGCKDIFGRDFHRPGM